MDFKATINNLQNKIKVLKAGHGHTKMRKISKNAGVLMKMVYKILGKISYDNEKILGLEISPHYIRICQMRNSYDRWILTHLASTCMEDKFTNNDITLNTEEYVIKLEELLKKHNIRTNNVALSIPTSSSVIKIINMPDMEEEDLAEAAAMGAIWESMVQLDGSIREYSVYYEVLQRKVKPSESLRLKDISGNNSLDSLLSSPSLPIENIPQIENSTPQTEGQNQADQVISTDTVITEPTDINVPNFAETTPLPEEEATTMDILFVATKLADAQTYIEIAQKAGLNPIIIDTKCNVLNHAFNTNPNKHKIPHPYAIIEFGPNENYAFIIEDDIVATYNIILSDDDKQMMSRNVSDFDIFKDFVNRYADQLKVILENYEKQSKNGSKVNNIYVISNTPLHVDSASAEPPINEFINHLNTILLGHEISTCNFCNYIDIPQQFAKKVNAEGNLAAWATVLGLASYKVDVFDYNKDITAIEKVNLIPGADNFKRSRAIEILSGTAMASILAFVIVAMGGVHSVMLSYGISVANEIKKLDPIKKDFEEKNTELQQLSVVMDKVKSLDGVRAKVPSNQSQILTAYRDVNAAIPEGVWLTSINFTLPKDVEIKGNSVNDQNILEFIKKINEGSGLKKVSLKNMEVHEKDKNTKDKSDASQITTVKKFVLQGELIRDEKAEKLELLSGGARNGS